MCHHCLLAKVEAYLVLTRRNGRITLGGAFVQVFICLDTKLAPNPYITAMLSVAKPSAEFLVTWNRV